MYFARERKVLSFDTSPHMNERERELTIRLRNFSVERAIDAQDAGEVVDAVERPSVCFEDVIGAESAKESLKFVVDWLQNPGRFMAQDIRPPKGILLTGPPGNGQNHACQSRGWRNELRILYRNPPPAL